MHCPLLLGNLSRFLASHRPPLRAAAVLRRTGKNPWGSRQFYRRREDGARATCPRAGHNCFGAVLYPARRPTDVNAGVAAILARSCPDHHGRFRARGRHGDMPTRARPGAGPARARTRALRAAGFRARWNHRWFPRCIRGESGEDERRDVPASSRRSQLRSPPPSRRRPRYKARGSACRLRRRRQARKFGRTCAVGAGVSPRS